MRRALQLARRGLGRTHPNPPVGALVVCEGRVIGEGFHRRAGLPHAEVEALRGLDRAQTTGATLYVTLEPCSTQGRTPPCTDAILYAGIKRVVVSALDPNPKHAGRGLRRLRRQGVEVVGGVCRNEGEALIAPFAKWVTTARPYITLKMAMTLDGRIADGEGRSRWITGISARREVHALRRQVDAIMVGTSTACVDNPSLRASPSLRGRHPLRLILDASGRLPLESKVLRDGLSTHTVVVVTGTCPVFRRKTLEDTGAAVWTCGRGRHVNLEALVLRAGREGLLHLLCEGGGILAEALVKASLVDEYLFFVAARFLGGSGAPVLGGKGWLLPQAPFLTVEECRRVGDDVLIKAKPRRGNHVQRTH